MSSDPPMAAPSARGGPAPDDVTLAGLLAVLWRRRAIVVLLTGLGLVAGLLYILLTKPLYRATAAVRPGITAFTDRGDPIREWKLKDITFWFSRGMYADEVRRVLGWPPNWPRPKIDAEFIPRGSQNIQGGDVITLETLSPDPQLATAILEAAVAAFLMHAASDSVASGLALTRAGLEIQIASLRNDLDKLTAKGERVALNLAAAEQDLAALAADRRRVELEMDKVAEANQLRASLLAMAEEQAEGAAADRAELTETAKRLSEENVATIPADSLGAAMRGRDLTPWLLGSVLRGGAAAVGATSLSALELRRFEQHNRALADSLRYEIDLAGNTLVDLGLKRDVDLETKRYAIITHIGDLKLQQERELATERVAIEQGIRSRQAQRAALSPLERIGRTHVTPRPVRPRKLRAVAILTALGGFASVVVAFGWDFFVAHRGEILGRGRSS